MLRSTYQNVGQSLDKPPWKFEFWYSLPRASWTGWWDLSYGTTLDAKQIGKCNKHPLSSCGADKVYINFQLGRTHFRLLRSRRTLNRKKTKITSRPFGISFGSKGSVVQSNNACASSITLEQHRKSLKPQLIKSGEFDSAEQT